MIVLPSRARARSPDGPANPSGLRKLPIGEFTLPTVALLMSHQRHLRKPVHTMPGGTQVSVAVSEELYAPVGEIEPDLHTFRLGVNYKF